MKHTEGACRMITPGEVPFNNMKHHKLEFSPGTVIIYYNQRGIFRILLAEKGSEPLLGCGSTEDRKMWPGLAEDLRSYFAGRETEFNYPILMDGYSPWALKVLAITKRIPYGRTCTYSEVAEEAGAPGGARAVGQALARNRTPILIPCHRVVGQGGELVGFSCGLHWKRELLKLEGVLK